MSMTAAERAAYLAKIGVIQPAPLATPQARHRYLVEHGIIPNDGKVSAGDSITVSRDDLEHPAMVAFRKHAGISKESHRAMKAGSRSLEVRNGTDAGAVTLRLQDPGSNNRTLTGHFSVFNQWTTISSAQEGRFLERVSPGAFAETIDATRRGSIRVLFDHGQDGQVGNKPLGRPEVLREDNVGTYYEVPLIDSFYNRDFIIPAAQAGLLGASFRFKVPAGGDDWVMPRSASSYNPEALPERTLTKVDLFEFGPVTFPAYSGATAGIA